MKFALIIVDMLKDTFEKHPELYISKEAMKFVPTINHLSSLFRERGFPVIFACDSFLPGDFIFQGRLKPHSIRGTKGAEVIDQLDRGQGDMILEKRRFSAFFKTDLDQTLRTFGVDTVVVAGISTQVCVLTTVLDAVALDFKAILLKDCCAAHTPEIHDTVLRIYGNDFMAPIMRAMSCDKFITEML